MGIGFRARKTGIDRPYVRRTVHVAVARLLWGYFSILAEYNPVCYAYFGFAIN